jgi:hypothetical protein
MSNSVVAFIRFLNSVNFASIGRLFHSTAPLYTKLFLNIQYLALELELKISISTSKIVIIKICIPSNKFIF